MPGNYTHTTRSDGLILTAAIYNADHQNHVNNMTPGGVDDYSSNTTEMQTQTDPGEQGSESLSTDLAGELERIRYVLAEMKGQTYWYETAFGSLSDPAANQILHNTSFEIWQKGTSLTDVAGPIGTDGWTYTRGAGVGRGTLAQETAVVPTVAQVGTLVRASLSLTVTTNDAAIGAADFYIIQHKVEGYYFQPIAQRTFTLSFWVRSAATGTYCVAFRNGGADRSYVAEYTISSANTWEYKTITVTASPSAGTWNYTNGTGLYVDFALAVGSDRQTTAGAWNTGNFSATANQTNFFLTNSNTFYLAAPKITPGASASRWLPLPFEVEQRRAERYYEKQYDFGTAPGTAVTVDVDQYSLTGQALALGSTIPFRAAKRADPTITTYDAGGSSGVFNAHNGAWVSGIAVSDIGTPTGTQNGFLWRYSGSVTYQIVAFSWVASAEVT